MSLRKNQQNLRESYSLGDASSEEGLIRNVKVIGNDSLNGRRYLPEAIRSALPTYEGARVNIDHPERDPDGVRSLTARFGKLENLREEASGARADLRYNPHHPMAATVRWFAENMPDALGLSHNAVGQGRMEEGVFVVERIVSVRSVDLVADPATTKSLYESHSKGRMKVKLKSLLERLTGRKHAALKRLIEEDMIPGDMEVDPGPAGDTDHEAALTSGFEAGALAIIKQALAGDMDPKEALRKLKVLLKSHGDVTGGGTGAGLDDDVNLEDDDMGEGVKKSPYVKGLEARLDRLETEKKVTEKKAKAATLIAEAKLPKEAITPIFVEQLVEAKDEAAMKVLIADRKQLCVTERPRSLGAIPEGKNGTAAGSMTKEQFLKEAKRRS